MAVAKDPWGVKLPHPERACIDCKKYPCFNGMDNLKSNLAAYGCRYFKNKLW